MFKNILLLLITLYQKLVSPLLPAACRFYPSCSAYSREAILRHGPCRGLFFSVIRLCKCHPFHPGGHDPIP